MTPTTQTTPSGRTIRPGPGARCLYLGSRERKRVTCTAEALVVTNASAQTQRYPVARVARVVSHADLVDWSGQALALCMRAGIPITWLDTHGQPVGSVYPQIRPTLSLQTALEVWSEHEQGVQRYQNWLINRRMAVLMQWHGQHASSISPQQWENTKREWVYQAQFSVHLPLALRGLCLAYVAAQLASVGMVPTLWGPKLEGMDLDEDLCQLLWAEMNLCAGTLANKVQEDATRIAMFERWSTQNAAALCVHLAHLHRTALKALHP